MHKMYIFFTGREDIHIVYTASSDFGGTMQNHVYNARHQTPPWDIAMPSKKYHQGSDFGQRMTELRKAAGYTQVELAEELGISQRMISHYEGRAEHAPAAVLPGLAKALGVTTDELLGLKPVKKTRKPDTRLQRRLQQIQKLDARPRKQIMQLIDTFIEAEQLKQKMDS